jgi:hypothetical protein
MRLTPETSLALGNSLRHVTLTVKNGEFELVASGVPRKGVFHSSGDAAQLETILLFNQDAPKQPPINLNANPDGTITLDSPDSFDSHAIVLRRESQPPAANVRNR